MPCCVRRYESRVSQRDAEAPGRQRSLWVVAAWLVGGLALLFLAAAFLPRWWAHRIADQTDASMTQGIGVGLFYGFVFTLLPLALLWWGLRRASRWKTRLIVLGAALVLALPNLLTLGIVLGRGNAAHAGDRTLDVEAPGFRGAVLVGAIVAVAALVALIRLLRSRHHARERADRLEAELRGRDDTPGSTPLP
jgi:hypothetical protein